MLRAAMAFRLLLGASLVGQAAANFGVSLNPVFDVSDTTPQPGAAAVVPASGGYDPDTAFASALNHWGKYAAQTTTVAPPPKSIGQIFAGRAWGSIATVLVVLVVLTGFLMQVSFFVFKYGIFGTEPNESTKRYHISLGFVFAMLLMGVVLTFTCGLQQNAWPVFKQIEEFQGSVSAGVHGLFHKGSPVLTTPSPQVAKVAQAKLAAAAAASQQVHEVQHQIITIGSAPVAKAKVQTLQQKLAALKKVAQAKAAQALPPRPQMSAKLDAGYGGASYGAAPAAVAAAPLAVAAAAPPAAPPAAPKPMASPCGTTTPAAILAPTVAPPQVVNFMPPLGCTCKAASGNGKSFAGHCAIYQGEFSNLPVCVIKDKNCGGTTTDAGLGTSDLIVTCMQADESGRPYSVLLDRSTNDMHLGFDVAPDTSLKNLIITRMSNGLAGIWNSANPATQIKPGDLITKVNGQAGSAIGLMHEIIKKQQLSMALSSSNGWPIQMNAQAPATLAPQTFKTGDCSTQGHGWGDVSVCISNHKPFPPGSSVWHCPWESMMLMSTRDFGGCDAIKIDCASNVDAILGLYRAHDNNVTHPPEGSLTTVEYAQCCVTHQCKGGPACGLGPWKAGISVSPWVGKANPCGAAGCERLYSQSASSRFYSSVLPVVPMCFIVLASFIGFAFIAYRIMRSRIAGNRHLLLHSEVEDIEELADQEAPLHE